MNSSSSTSCGFMPLFFGGMSSALSEIRTVEILLALLAFVGINGWHQKRRQGLPSWPLIGMLPSLLFGLQGNVYDWITEVLVKKNGTFIFRGPCFSNLNCVITSDPGNVEYILKMRFTNFQKGEYFRDTVSDLLGEGIFSADGDVWKRQRKIASLEFHSSKFRKMTVDSLLDLVHERLLPVLEDAVQRSALIDLQDVLLRLTFDNVCMIAFGVDPRCLTLGLPEVPFAKAFEEATESTTMRFVTPTLLWKAMRWLGVGSEGRLKEAIRGVDEFAEEVIRARRMKAKTDTPDLLSAFMSFNDFSDKSLRDICVNFILAGRDTSSVALTWFFWLLNDHPKVEGKILQELNAIVLGRRAELGDSAFRPEEVQKMEYLQAALSEALRLYPSVPVDHKQVVEDDIFPDGTVLKKGTKVVYAAYAMGRSEEIWGEDCKKFIPERWMSDKARFSGASAYKFTAFNGGPRLCLGKDLAYYQMKFVAASVLRRYRVRVMEGHPVAPRMALTMYLKHGLQVQVLPR